MDGFNNRVHHLLLVPVLMTGVLVGCEAKEGSFHLSRTSCVNLWLAHDLAAEQEAVAAMHDSVATEAGEVFDTLWPYYQVAVLHSFEDWGGQGPILEGADELVHEIEAYVAKLPEDHSAKAEITSLGAGELEQRLSEIEAATDAQRVIIETAERQKDGALDRIGAQLQYVQTQLAPSVYSDSVHFFAQDSLRLRELWVATERAAQAAKRLQPAMETWYAAVVTNALENPSHPCNAEPPRTPSDGAY